MAFYLRKGVSFGPLRLNLSKSGVGVSAGVKGFRIGTGPRGNYIHAGRGGVYYRKTLPSSKGEQPTRPQRLQPAFDRVPETEAVESDLVDWQEFDSGSVVQMVDGDAADLLNELNEKQHRRHIWPLIATAAAAALVWGYAITSAPLLAVGLAGALVATPIAAFWDRHRKTTVLLYDLEPDLEAACRQLYEQYEALKHCERMWHIEGGGGVRDSKYHAGATHMIKRNRVGPTETAPPVIRTNLPVPTFPAGKQRLCFFPDRLLVFESNRVGAVPYHELEIDVVPSRFIEEDRVPRDTTVVDTTWRYVNKRGGPDKRFKDNKQLPVVLYEELRLTSVSGLQEHFQLSKPGVADEFKKAVLELRTR